MALFPNVPNLPGVPPLLRDPAAAARSYIEQNVVSFVSPVLDAARNLNGIVTGTLSSLLGAGDDIGNSATAPPPWGLFTEGGAAAIYPDAFLGLEYRNSYRVSNYPLEQGAFETYNKVSDPFDLVVRMSKGGDYAQRADFLATAAALADTLERFTLVTPEEVFQSVNVVRYSYSRSERNGAGLITVDLYLTEIRVNTQSEFTNQTDDPVTVDEAANATTSETTAAGIDTAALAPEAVQNPASASMQSGGQVQAQPATAAQSAAAPKSPTALPEGYTQSKSTGLVYGPNGKVDRDISVSVGSNYLGPARTESVQYGGSTVIEGP